MNEPTTNSDERIPPWAVNTLIVGTILLFTVLAIPAMLLRSRAVHHHYYVVQQPQVTGVQYVPSGGKFSKFDKLSK